MTLELNSDAWPVFPIATRAIEAGYQPDVEVRLWRIEAMLDLGQTQAIGELEALAARSDLGPHAAQLRRRIGYVFGGDKGLYDRISALDNLRFFADIYRVPLRAKQAD